MRRKEHGSGGGLLQLAAEASTSEGDDLQQEPVAPAQTLWQFLLCRETASSNCTAASVLCVLLIFLLVVNGNITFHQQQQQQKQLQTPPAEELWQETHVDIPDKTIATKRTHVYIREETLPTRYGPACVMEEQMDFDGNNIEGAEEHVASVDECCNLCRIVEGCKAWTWKRAERDPSKSTCFPKIRVGHSRIRSKHTSSGVRCEYKGVTTHHDQGISLVPFHTREMCGDYPPQDKHGAA